jgi:hypothetical protein
MKSSKNVINNKNVIQICCDRPKRRRKQERRPKSNNDSDIRKYLTKDYTPQFVNSFPNSTQLQDDRKVRFIQAMRDPFSTKSPYSIFDNGSNTFQREGNTIGAEQPTLPPISQRDYFENPRSLASRPTQRFQVGDSFQNSSKFSPIADYSNLINEEEFGDLESVADSDADNTWYAPNLQKLRGALDEEEEYDDIPPDERYVDQSFTRFSSNQPFAQPPPAFQTPYRGPQQLTDDPIIIETPKTSFGPFSKSSAFDETPQSEALPDEQSQIEAEILQAQAEIDENTRRKQEQQQAYEALAIELKRKKEIRKKFTSVSDKLKELVSSGAKKVEKDSDLKKEVVALLKDQDFKEYSGERNIRNLSGAQKLLNFINKGSDKLLAEIKQIEDDKKESPVKRQGPRSRSNIQTFASAGGGGSAYSRLPISKR